jgi:hypothetical protein
MASFGALFWIWLLFVGTPPLQSVGIGMFNISLKLSYRLVSQFWPMLFSPFFLLAVFQFNNRYLHLAQRSFWPVAVRIADISVLSLLELGFLAFAVLVTIAFTVNSTDSWPVSLMAFEVWILPIGFPVAHWKRWGESSF